MKHYVLLDDVKHVAVIPSDDNITDHIAKAIFEDRCMSTDKVTNITLRPEDMNNNIKVLADTVENGDNFADLEFTLTPITVYGFPKSFKPHDLTNKERRTIDFLSSSLNDLKTGVEHALPAKEVSWINDLIDHVDVSLGKEPDGDNQHLIVNNEEAMTYVDMFQSIMLRIHRAMEYIVDENGNVKV